MKQSHPPAFINASTVLAEIPFTKLKERKSTRLFSKKQVEQEKLDIILEAGRIAPTAKNLQPYKVYVVQSAEGLDKIDKATKCRYNSPCVLMICGNKDTTYVKNDKPTVVYSKSNDQNEQRKIYLKDSLLMFVVRLYFLENVFLCSYFYYLL